MNQFCQACYDRQLKINSLTAKLEAATKALEEIHRPYKMQHWEYTDTRLELSRVRDLAYKTLKAIKE